MPRLAAGTAHSAICRRLTATASSSCLPSTGFSSVQLHEVNNARSLCNVIGSASTCIYPLLCAGVQATPALVWPIGLRRKARHGMQRQADPFLARAAPTHFLSTFSCCPGTESPHIYILFTNTRRMGGVCSASVYVAGVGTLLARRIVGIGTRFPAASFSVTYIPGRPRP